jgi:hypothetical protein
MSQIPPDFFDLLPWHPRPQPLESLTGYLTRLAQGNGIRFVKRLISTCFPGDSPLPICSLSDYPPASWGALPLATNCPEPVLLTTTFYYLAQKFGRAARPQSMGRFLQSSLSSNSRYCPACLAEDGLHVLPWRFLTLTGCARHGNQLLDQCGHCGRPIPTLPTPPTLWICPSCRGDLRCCSAEPLPEREWQRATQHYQDLCFLLGPHPLTLASAEEVIEFVGLRLAYRRSEMGLVALDFARQAGLPHWAVYGLEGHQACGGAKFERYVQYAAHLGVTLRQVFNTSLPPEIEKQTRQVPRRTTLLDEQACVAQVEAAIRTLETDGQLVSQAAICRMIGKSPGSLRLYPRVKAILEQVVAQLDSNRRRQAQEREQALLQRVQMAVDQLKAEGKAVTRRTVSHVLGLSWSGLSRYPRVKASIATAVIDSLLARQRQLEELLNSPFPAQNFPSSHRKTSLRREEALVEAVQAAIQCLKANGEPVTQTAIGRIVGRCPSSLWHYPRVMLILELIAIERHLACQRQVVHNTPVHQERKRREINPEREAELVEAVQMAIQHLQAEGKSVTLRAISRVTGVTKRTLKAYPRVKAIWVGCLQFRQQQRQQREQMLVAQVQTAVARLEALGEPLVQANIAQAVGVSQSQLRSHPQVRSILNEIKHQRHVMMMAHRQERDRTLAAKVRQAAETLTRLGQPLTKQMIGEMVGMTPSGLKKYPYTQETLDRIIRNG